MKTLTSLVLFLLVSWSSLSQEMELKRYSYSKLFQMIEEEQDTIFRLKNAEIVYNEATDSLFQAKANNSIDSIISTQKQKVINKVLFLDNVQFLTSKDKEDETVNNGVLQHITFLKEVTFSQCASIPLFNCHFKGRLYLFLENRDNQIDNIINYIQNTWNQGEFQTATFGLTILNCHFYNETVIASSLIPHKLDYPYNLTVIIDRCTFYEYQPLHENYNSNFFLIFRSINNLHFANNRIIGESTLINFVSDKVDYTGIEANEFLESSILLRVTEMQGINLLNISKNSFGNHVGLAIDTFDPKHIVDWESLKGKLFSTQTYDNYFYKTNPPYINISTKDLKSYLDQRLQDKDIFKGELALRGKLLNHYNDILDTESKNSVYIELKDLETQKLAYEYKTAPSFDTYFQWKVNQFLKLFSNYGTKPSKAIIFSLYVIIFFAIIYLFFPNSWDSHGRKRIMDRFTFFIKYMKKDAGIHEVYLEDKQPDLMEYEAFKNLLIQASPQVPKFFIMTGLPLYKWTIARTNLHASILSKFDIMKGTWQDLPLKKRFWKSILLIGAFLVAIIYDLFIKILNALMLSINTFTTLGFGEIPIKGFPRYLAILQGFIGWFMLTIFSVSLISQLLN
ncbi:potassium channel family protein [Mangrovimonas xylaniphaga]|uniref:potassium channel family protein n=1 Tax=Mangrovimonas xylaniphaga TaxID=1645915 RepID=UPI0006B6622B|nr:potassium channel family protein [Mangrovimonas xylaniphaga]